MHLGYGTRYIDGHLEACNMISHVNPNPRPGGIWDENGGQFDPLGAIRVCGRAKPAAWNDETEQGVSAAFYTPLIERVTVSLHCSLGVLISVFRHKLLVIKGCSCINRQ